MFFAPHGLDIFGCFIQKKNMKLFGGRSALESKISKKHGWILLDNLWIGGVVYLRLGSLKEGNVGRYTIESVS